MPRVTTVSNHKGGTGKTNVAVQLAAALARAGRKVLVVDLDPQGNASRRLGLAIDESCVTMTEVILAAGQANGAGVGEQAVRRSGWDAPEGAAIDVLPSRLDLIAREAEASQLGSVRRLRTALAGWIDRYDVVLIDTRPDVGHLVQLALAVSTDMLLVVKPEYDSLKGAITIAEFAAEHAADLTNPGLRVSGVVVTQRKATAEQDFQLTSTEAAFGELLYQTVIPDWTRFAEADGAAAPVSAWTDERGRQTTAIYDALCAEYLRKG